MYFHHCVQQFTTTGQNSQFLGAFLGAFFAFFFGLIAFFVTTNISNKRKRFIKHKNAIVKLEQLLNTHIDEVTIAQYTAKSIQEILESGAFVTARFNKFKLINDLPFELASINLINKYFEYSRNMVRFNLDFSSINYSLTRFEDAVLANIKLSEDNRKYLIKAVSDKPKILNHLEADTKEFLAIVRLYLSKIRNCNPTICGMLEKFDPEITPEELSAELVKLEEEISRKEAM